jgi:hypothetical protein
MQTAPTFARHLRLKTCGILPRTETMTAREGIVLLFLALAGWGHLLVNDLLGAAAAWTRADERFPVAWRCPAPIAGILLLGMGSAGVLTVIAG